MAQISLFFGWLLRSSAQATVLASLILIIHALLRNKLSAPWRHALWFLLLARLAMPWSPQSPTSVFNLVNLLPHEPKAQNIFVRANLTRDIADAPTPKFDDVTSRPAAPETSQTTSVAPHTADESSVLPRPQVARIAFEILPPIWLARAFALAATAARV